MFNKTYIIIQLTLQHVAFVFFHGFIITIILSKGSHNCNKVSIIKDCYNWKIKCLIFEAIFFYMPEDNVI